ncbi:hypothetical protein [Caballeronia sp. INDeC2]|uniref:hypothetical protein n=1 Tax=Caballeronia sp. INDeC2 TaxID=2921747 RepID=UPI0020276CF4|nr:hypothetical protein [Caballeronia sp. INDeC2]
MNRNLRHRTIVAFACACMTCGTSAWAQQNGAPPGNTSSQGDTGKSAGVAGGAGAAGQSGTDPATLSRIEEQRVQKKNGAQGASSAPNANKRKDWKE